jgi:hypothetical protein
MSTAHRRDGKRFAELGLPKSTVSRKVTQLEERSSRAA